MFEVLKRFLFLILCVCLIVSLFLTLLPNGEVDERGNPIFQQFTFRDFLNAMKNAPTINIDWVKKIHVEVVTLYDEEGNEIPNPNPKPSGTNIMNIGSWIQWAVKEIAYNNKINEIFNKYLLMPLRAGMIVINLLANVFIYAGYGLCVIFGVV